MTRNPKPNELPQPIDDLPAVSAPLIIDSYLSRQAVIDRIVDRTGIDVSPTGGKFGHTDLAALLRHADPDEDRDPELISATTSKYEIVTDLAVIYGFPARGDQDTLIKSQLVHVLLTLVQGDEPDPFELPSDPDKTAKYDDVPVLGDA